MALTIEELEAQRAAEAAEAAQEAQDTPAESAPEVQEDNQFQLEHDQVARYENEECMRFERLQMFVLKAEQAKDRTAEFESIASAFRREFPFKDPARKKELEDELLKVCEPGDKIVPGWLTVLVEKVGDKVLPVYIPSDYIPIVYGDLTAQSVMQLKQKAETLSGIPMDQLTTEQALLILGGKSASATLKHPDASIAELSRIYNTGDMWAGWTGLIQNIINTDASNIKDKQRGRTADGCYCCLPSDDAKDFMDSIESLTGELGLSADTKDYFKRAISNSASIAKENAMYNPLDTGEEVLKIISEELDKLILREKSKRTKAEDSGALIAIGDRLMVITDKDYQSAFMTSIKGKCGFYIRAQDGKKLALDVDPEFLRALASTILAGMQNGNDIEKGTDIYFPALADKLHIDFRSANKDDNGEPVPNRARSEARAAFVHKAISGMDKIWGFLPNSSIEYRLISVLQYDPATEIIHFISPYLNQIILSLKAEERRRLNAGEKYYYWHSDLLHASAANERNKAAVEMAVRILQGVEQRGTTPDSKLDKNKKKNFSPEDKDTVTYSISLAGLIEDCVQIRERLKANSTTKEKTQTLKRSLSAMYRILDTKSDLGKCYLSLKIDEVPYPSMKRLSDEITITHKGKDPNYHAPVVVTAQSGQESQKEG